MSYPNLHTRYTFIVNVANMFICENIQIGDRHVSQGLSLGCPAPNQALYRLKCLGLMWIIPLRVNDNKFWAYTHIMKSWYYEENVCLSYKFFEKSFVSQMMQNRHLKQRALGQTKPATYCFIELAHLYLLCQQLLLVIMWLDAIQTCHLTWSLVLTREIQCCQLLHRMQIQLAQHVPALVRT